MRRYLHTNTLIFLLVAFIAVYTEFYIIYIILIPYLLFIINRHKKHSLIIIPIIMFCFVLSIEFRNISNQYVHHAKVLKVYSSSALVKESGMKYYILGVNEQILPGDKITFNAKYISDIENGSFEVYWRSLGASAYGYASDVVIDENSAGLRNGILESLINNHDYYSQNILALFYGISTDYNASLLNRVTKLGVSHLFVISGFHIAIFYIGLERIGLRITNNRKIINISSASISFIFVFFIYFPLTAIRALVTLIIVRTHKFNKIDSLSICGIIFFVINPYIMISNSMILSFSITYVIYLLSGGQNNIKKTLLISIVAFYVSLPTVTTWTNELNLLAPLVTIIITQIVSFSYVLGLVILPFHFLWWIGDIYFMFFDYLILILTVLYIPVYFPDSNIFKQYLGTSLILLYIIAMRGNRLILLNTLFSMSFIFFII